MTGRRRGATPRRESRRNRRTKVRVLIACEGKETERQYFDLLKRDDRVVERFSVTVKGGKGGTREAIARRAIDRKMEHDTAFDEYWCVMDVEGSSHRESLDKALVLLDKHDITPCLSNPAFEVWFLAHFEQTAGAFNDCAAVIVKLNKHWKTHFGGNYGKTDDRTYSRLSGLIDTAVSHAKWVREKHHAEFSDTCDCNSSTDVYKLVTYLLTGKKDDESPTQS